MAERGEAGESMRGVRRMKRDGDESGGEMWREIAEVNCGVSFEDE